jgi:hypothetical protein
MGKGVPAQRGPLLFDDDFTIVATYGSEYRGYVQYYLLAQDVWRLGRMPPDQPSWQRWLTCEWPQSR